MMGEGGIYPAYRHHKDLLLEAYLSKQRESRKCVVL